MNTSVLSVAWSRIVALGLAQCRVAKAESIDGQEPGRRQQSLAAPAALLLVAALGVMPSLARAQIFVAITNDKSVAKYTTSGTVMNATLVSGLPFNDYGLAVSGSDLFVTTANGVVRRYDASTGALVNAAFITGLTGPRSLVVSGSLLYVASDNNGTNGTVGVYNANTGAAVTASLVTGLSGLYGLAVSGSDLYVSGTDAFGANITGGVIGRYNANTGTPINATMITGLNFPQGIAVSGSDLFVTSGNTGANYGVGKFDAVTGATANASLITGLDKPRGVAVSGSNLFVTSAGTFPALGYIGEYTTSGSVVNATLISGLNFPTGIAVASAIPEPSTWALLVGLGALGFAGWRRRCSPGAR